MNEFQNFVNEYGKILNSIFNNNLKVGSLFAPKNPFEITEENYVSGALYKGSDVYGGRVEKILSNDEFILNKWFLKFLVILMNMKWTDGHHLEVQLHMLNIS